MSDIHQRRCPYNKDVPPEKCHFCQGYVDAFIEIRTQDLKVKRALLKKEIESVDERLAIAEGMDSPKVVNVVVDDTDLDDEGGAGSPVLADV